MIYELLQKALAKREDARKVNPTTDTEISATHRFNYRFTKKYIQNKKVLDVGCWTGQFEQLAIQTTKQMVGIDPDIHAIRFAKTIVKGPRFLKGTATKLQFKNSSFDVVTFLDVIEHIPADTEIVCLKEIARVLKPNGIIILSTNNKHPIAILFDPAFWGFGHRHYSTDELEHMLGKSGFSVLRVVKSGGFWRITAFVLDMVAKHIFRFKLVYPQSIQRKIANDFKPGGIMTIHVVARKAG